MRRGGRWPAALVSALVLVAGCTTTTVRLDGGPGPPTGGQRPCDPLCTGTIAGSRFAVRVPEHWNGTLLIYAHGYHHDTGHGPGRAQLAFGDTTGTASGPVAARLLAAGYVLAGSSYDRNGWTVASAVDGVVALHARVAVWLHPKRTYVWGASMGGLITELVAERHLGWVDGAAPLCGVLAGPLDTFDQLLEAAVVARALLDPALPVPGPTTTAQGLAAAAQAQRAVARAVAHAPARVLFLAGVLGLSGPSRHHDTATRASRLRAAAESLTSYLDLALTTRSDLVQRFGGNPARTVRLTAALPASVADDIRAAGGDPGSLAAAVRNAPAVAADPGARAALAASGVPSGRLRVPTVTMHTEYDAVVLPAGERVFAARARAAGSSARLVSLWVAPPAHITSAAGAPFGATHCGFAPRQVVGAMHLLDRWVTARARPGATAQRAAVGPGLDPGFVPPRWPSALPR